MSTLVIGLALVAGLAGAPASGVPPIGLPACGEAQDVGGWEMRDFVATGTAATDPSPVRLRNVRLSEPCYTPVAGTEVGLLTIPMRATDISVPIKDDNDDGHDDGPPDLDDYVSGGPSCVGGACASLLGQTGFYRHAATTWSTVTVFCFSAVGWNTGDRLRLYFDAQTFTASGGDVITRSAGSDIYQFGQSTGVNYYTGPITAPDIYPSGSSVSCPSGTTGYVTVSISKNSTAKDWSPRFAIRGYSFVSGTVTAPETPVGGLELGTDYYGGTQGAQFVPGAGHTMVPSGEDTMIYCATSYSGAETTTYAWDSSLPWVASYLLESDTEADSLGPPRIKDGQATAWSAMGHVGITDATFTSANCPYLVRIELWVCIYVDHGPNDYSCAETTWTADKYREHGWYEDNGTPVGHICTLYPDDPQCYEVLNPPYIDGTSWDDTCGKNFPQLAWGDWDWLPSVVRHLSSCLFTPVNGLDRLGWVRNAVDNSALGQVNELLNAGLDSFAFSPGCGPLVDDTDGPTGLELNTCEWSDWAGQFRPIMATVLVVGFALWALHFIISMLTGIPNKVVPNPTSNKGD